MPISSSLRTPRYASIGVLKLKAQEGDADLRAQDTAKISSDVESYGKVRMELDYKLFKGVSVIINDVDKAEDTVMRIAESNSAVKNVWPLQTYSIPKPNVEWIGKPDIESSDLKKRQDEGNGTVGDFAPHVMTQIDKLHEKGIKGKGIQIAVIDTGVSYICHNLFFAWSMLSLVIDRLHPSGTRRRLLR